MSTVGWSFEPKSVAVILQIDQGEERLPEGSPPLGWLPWPLV